MGIKATMVALALLAGTGAAQANCYEGLGCDDSEMFSRGQLRQLSCQALWEVRNLIYQQNGYCFQTERALKVFDNEGCWITEQSRVRLNSFERANVETIVATEQAKGCR